MKKYTYLHPFVSHLIYKLPKRYIKRYKRKYLGCLQGETRKLYKISEDKNLMESVHGKISHIVWNLAWCAKSLAASSGFAWCAKFRTAMQNCWLLDFFLWFSSLHLLLAKGHEVLQSLDSSCIWVLTCIVIDFIKFSLIFGLFQW